MTIKQNQILTQKAKKRNPVSALPRDVKPGMLEIVDETVQDSASNEEITLSPESSNFDVVAPSVPIILSVKSQTVTPKDDGTFSVDVILEVDGITSEYEVRITKSAG